MFLQSPATSTATCHSRAAPSQALPTSATRSIPPLALSVARAHHKYPSKWPVMIQSKSDQVWTNHHSFLEPRCFGMPYAPVSLGRMQNIDALFISTALPGPRRHGQISPLLRDQEAAKGHVGQRRDDIRPGETDPGHRTTSGQPPLYF